MKAKTLDPLTIVKIANEALHFECCPECGNVKIENHPTTYKCPKCKARFAETDDAIWFCVYLQDKYGLKLTEGK